MADETNKREVKRVVQQTRLGFVKNPGPRAKAQEASGNPKYARSCTIPTHVEW
jgi:hypothetical protein